MADEKKPARPSYPASPVAPVAAKKPIIPIRHPETGAALDRGPKVEKKK